MDQLHLAYALVGTLGVALAAVSSRIRDLPLSEPLLALLVGVLVGPEVLGWIHVPEEQRTTLVLELTRGLLAVSLIGVALRFPARRLRGVLSPTLLLVTVGMLAMAALSSGVAWVVLGVPPALALLIGACVCPTDPVLASSVVTGKPAEQHLPERLRQLLSTESGTNDGLALPLVLVAVALALGESLGTSLLDGLYQVTVGVVVGVVAGLLAGRAVSTAMRHSDVDPGASLVFTLVLAFAVLGLARVLDADGVLSVFVAGLAYNHTVADDEVGPQGQVDEGINRYLVLPLFLLLGTVLPWTDWRELGWGVVLLPLAILVLRRLPVVLALARPLGLGRADALFVGWFGPIGVSALFYLALSHDEGVVDPVVWTAVTLVVAASTLAHGVTSAPGRRAYRRLTDDRPG